MDTDEKNITIPESQAPEDLPITPVEEQSKIDEINALEDDIIRNDTIPETKDEPGSIGAYPVGAFDTSKD